LEHPRGKEEERIEINKRKIQKTKNKKKENGVEFDRLPFAWQLQSALNNGSHQLVVTICLVVIVSS
jgi:hypothetical protein